MPAYLSRRSKRPTVSARSVLGLILLALIGLAGCQWNRSGAGGTSVNTDAPPAPDFDLAGLDGRPYRLSEFEGRVLLVEFWATWCGPCRMQAEILSRLYEEVQSEDLEFLAVSLGESEEIVRDFVRKDPFPYPVLLDPEESLGYALEVYALPTVMIVDGAGRITFMQPGISDGETLRRALAAAAG